MSRIGAVITDPNDLGQIADAVTLIQKTVDSQIEFGNPQNPADQGDTLAGSGSPTVHNGELMNIKGSWVQVNYEALNTAVILNHNLDRPVFNSEVNVSWIVMQILHSGTTVDAASTISFNFNAGDLINENQIELRAYAAGARTVNADNPIQVTFFVIPGNRRPAGDSEMGAGIPPDDYEEILETEPLISALTFMQSDSADNGWLDKIEFDSRGVLPPQTNGPWRSTEVGASPVSPNGDPILICYDTTYTTNIPTGTEYEAYQSTDKTLAPVVDAYIDAGNIDLSITIRAVRHTLETDDEFRIGVYWINATGDVIGSEESNIIGTAEGLLSGAGNYVEFTRLITIIPPLTRNYRVRIIAKRNNTDGAIKAARMNFQLVQVKAVTNVV